MYNLNFTTNHALWGARGGARASGSRLSAKWQKIFFRPWTPPPHCDLNLITLNYPERK